jgi:hypothetical protein
MDLIEHYHSRVQQSFPLSIETLIECPYSTVKNSERTDRKNKSSSWHSVTYQRIIDIIHRHHRYHATTIDRQASIKHMCTTMTTTDHVTQPTRIKHILATSIKSNQAYTPYDCVRQLNTIDRDRPLSAVRK